MTHTAYHVFRSALAAVALDELAKLETLVVTMPDHRLAEVEPHIITAMAARRAVVAHINGQ